MNIIARNVNNGPVFYILVVPFCRGVESKLVAFSGDWQD